MKFWERNILTKTMSYFFKNSSLKWDEDNEIPIGDFFQAYIDCRKRKRGTVNALKFELNYESELVDLYKKVNSRRYEIGRSITFVVTRPKDREVFAADFRDRIIHHIIMQRLEPLFEKEFIEDSYSCRKGKGTLYGVERLRDKVKALSNNYTEDCWIGKFDLKGFFMSIHKPTLWTMLKEFIDKNYHEKDKDTLLYLVEKVVLHAPQHNCKKKSPERFWKRLPKNKSLFTCDKDRGLPIGNLTSQCFANFYLNLFDWIMTKIFNGYYGRYVDDFYVLAKSKEEIVRRIKFMKEFLKKRLKLTLHPDKIYIQHYTKGVKFTGSVVKMDKIKIGSITLGGLYKTIHKFNVIPRSLEGALEFQCKLNSYLGFMVHGDSYYKRQRMWEKVDPKWHRYLYPSNDYKRVKLDKYFNPVRNKQDELLTKRRNYHDRYF